MRIMSEGRKQEREAERGRQEAETQCHVELDQHVHDYVAKTGADSEINGGISLCFPNISRSNSQLHLSNNNRGSANLTTIIPDPAIPIANSGEGIEENGRNGHHRIIPK